MNNSDSRKSMSKCNSSPLSTFAKRKAQKLSGGMTTLNVQGSAYSINQSNYNSTKPYRDIREQETQMEQSKLIYKSNS